MIRIKDIMFNILFKRDIKGCILFKYLSIKGCIQEYVSRVYSLSYSYYVHYYVQVIVKRVLLVIYQEKEINIFYYYKARGVFGNGILGL